MVEAQRAANLVLAWRRQFGVLAVLVAAVANIVGPTGATAAPGDLDTAFADGGLLRTPVGETSHAYALGRQSTGKLIVAACSITSAPPRFVVARYSAGGTLDTTFGTEGITAVIFPGSTAACETGVSPLGSDVDIAIRPDDRILVIGSVEPEGGPQDFAAFQLTTSGQLDEGFGSDGGTLLHPGDPTWHAGARGLVLEPGGRAVIVGEARSAVDDGDPELSSFAAVRIEADGVIDGSFGTGGEFVQEMTENAVAGSGQYSGAEDIVRYPDGRIALIGTAYDNWSDGDGSYRFRLAAVRLGSEGKLDPSFSGDGLLVTPVHEGNDHARGHSATLGAGGRLTVGLRYDEHLIGSSYSAAPMVARFDEEGDPDDTFGDTDGSAVLDFGQTGNPYIGALAYQPDGKLVVSGVGDGNFYFALARLDSKGDLDPEFGANGITLGPPFGGDAWDRAWAQDLLIEPSGKIVLAGFATADADPAPHLALARYHGDPNPSASPPAMNDADDDPPPTHPPAPTPPPVPRPEFKLLAIGDSVTAGFGYHRNGSPVKPIGKIRRRTHGRIPLGCFPPDPPDNRCSSPNVVAYPARLARLHGLHASTEFRNYAVSGSRPSYWLTRERLARIRADDPDLILLTLGANPLLTDFVHPKSSAWWRCVVGDWLSPILRQCVKRKLIDEYKVPFYLRTLYRRLILDTRADIAVLLYYPTKPDTISARKAIFLLNELNRAIRTAVAQARRRVPKAMRHRLKLIAPGPFWKHRCGTSRAWVLKTDFCIHPNTRGHEALALAVERKIGHLLP